MEFKSQTKAVCFSLEVPFDEKSKKIFYRQAVKKLAESLMANNCLQFDEMREIMDNTVRLRFALTTAEKPIKLPR